LLVPEGEILSPKHAVKKTDQWFKKLRKAATWGKDSRDPSRDRGDLLIFVHGYNNDRKIVMDRHAQLKKDLGAAGFTGEILSFGWPSSDKALNYVEVRHDAKRTAMRLGVAPRVGRVGLPGDAPAKAVNIDCTEYFRSWIRARRSSSRTRGRSWARSITPGTWAIGCSHSIDRSVIPTRTADANGKLKLVRA
jgi:hypothetical protein